MEKKRYTPKPGTNTEQICQTQQAELRSAWQTGRLPLRERDEESGPIPTACAGEPALQGHSLAVTGAFSTGPLTTHIMWQGLAQKSQPFGS
jgi:hypothetical protein